MGVGPGLEGHCDKKPEDVHYCVQSPGCTPSSCSFLCFTFPAFNEHETLKARSDQPGDVYYCKGWEVEYIHIPSHCLGYLLLLY